MPLTRRTDKQRDWRRNAPGRANITRSAAIPAGRHTLTAEDLEPPGPAKRSRLSSNPTVRTNLIKVRYDPALALGRKRRRMRCPEASGQSIH